MINIHVSFDYTFDRVQYCRDWAVNTKREYTFHADNFTVKDLAHVRQRLVEDVGQPATQVVFGANTHSDRMSAATNVLRDDTWILCMSPNQEPERVAARNPFSIFGMEAWVAPCAGNPGSSVPNGFILDNEILIVCESVSEGVREVVGCALITVMAVETK